MSNETICASTAVEPTDARCVALHAGNGNDPHRLATSRQMVLEGPRLLDADAVSLASYAGSLWQTPDIATSWLRIDGDVALEFFCGDQQHLHQRAYPTLDLIGLTLWAPDRVMLAYFSHWTNSWIDRGGFECNRIVFSARR